LVKVFVALCASCAFLGYGVPAHGAAQSPLAGDPIRITRANGSFTIDGDLSDEGWRGATRIDKWYEVRPGDNVEPPVKNVGYLTYDDRFFYAGFEFEDPDPRAMRAPFADRDDIGNGFSDYGGILLDPRNTGRTATFFVVTPRNIQYDSTMDDNTGEDSSPDYFWQSATRIGERGWTLEIRIPFSSLRYRTGDPQTWTILLYRNYPRTYHYQFFSAKLPRDDNCFVCRSNTLVGLEHLPGGGHLVAAPYVSAGETARARDEVGSPLVGDRVKAHVGFDVKWTPNADNAVDLAVMPDFSQVESDTAQISANERFALFFPEKRPFFLEGADLFRTPIQAVYTRTITSPRWGGRVTGKEAGVRYTVLVADDAGGGRVILPGPNESSFAPQDFASTVFVARAKRDIKLSSVGLLVTDREAKSGEAHNRVLGPDFQWRPSGSDVVSGQYLFTDTRTPNRPDDAAEWTGQAFTGHAALAQWNHKTKHLDWSTQYKQLSDGFRADTGFVPQVGYREAFANVGWEVRPQGVVRLERTFVDVGRQVDQQGALISRTVRPGVFVQTKFNGFAVVQYVNERVRGGDRLFDRQQIGYFAQFSPSRVFQQIGIDGTVGGDVDFENARQASGTTINLSATLHPTNHLAVEVLRNRRRLDVLNQPLLTARVSRVKSTYTFTSRMFVRAIAQYVSTDRDPSLFVTPPAARSGESGASLLLAYKLNWQSVMFVGYGDDRELTPDRELAPRDRQFFVKLSYAFQR
jgi:Domain of unknown function (DUF5916)